MVQSWLVAAGNGDYSSASAAALSRFFFVLGQTALQQLVHVEQISSAVRRQRLAAEKRAAEAQAERLASGESGGVSLPWTQSSCSPRFRVKSYRELMQSTFCQGSPGALLAVDTMAVFQPRFLDRYHVRGYGPLLSCQSKAAAVPHNL